MEHAGVLVVYRQAVGELAGECRKMAAKFGMVMEMASVSSELDVTPEHADGKVVIAFGGVGDDLPLRLAERLSVPVLAVPYGGDPESSLEALRAMASGGGGDGAAPGVLATGAAGAKNAVLAAIAIHALHDEALARKLEDFRKAQCDQVMAMELPPLG